MVKKTNDKKQPKETTEGKEIKESIKTKGLMDSPISKKPSIQSMLFYIKEGKLNEAKEVFDKLSYEDKSYLFKKIGKLYEKKDRTDEEKRISKAVFEFLLTTKKDKYEDEYLYVTSVEDILNLIERGVDVREEKTLESILSSAITNGKADVLDFIYENFEGMDWHDWNYKYDLFMTGTIALSPNERVLNIFTNKIILNPLISTTLLSSISHDRLRNKIERYEKEWIEAVEDSLKRDNIKDGMAIFKRRGLLNEGNKKHVYEFLDSLLNFENVVEDFKKMETLDKETEKKLYYFLRLYYVLPISIESKLKDIKEMLRQKNKKKVESFMQWIKEKNQKSNSNYDEALIKSIKEGNISTSLYFLSKGANINAKDKRGNSIIHLVIQEGNLHYLELFTESFQDVIDWYVKNNRGEMFIYPLISEKTDIDEEINMILNLLDNCILKKTFLNPFIGERLSSLANTKKIKEFFLNYEKMWETIMKKDGKEALEELKKMRKPAAIQGFYYYIINNCDNKLVDIIMG